MNVALNGVAIISRLKLDTEHFVGFLPVNGEVEGDLSAHAQLHLFNNGAVTKAVGVLNHSVDAFVI